MTNSPFDNPICFLEFQTLDSTNSWLKIHGKKFPDQILCIRANEQTQGRGRYNRVWEQKPGQDLAMSIGFKTNKSQGAVLAQLPLFVAISLHKFLKKLGLDSEIKWPNDLLVNQKKISGILCEALWQGDEVYFIVGVGLNVNSEFYNSEIKNFEATSLKAELGIFDENLTISKLYKSWSKIFIKEIHLFLINGLSPYLEYLNENLFLQNHWINFTWIQNSEQKDFYGLLKEVDSQGNLLIELTNKEELRLSHGEVRIKKV